jgi:hypothetical protein
MSKDYLPLVNSELDDGDEVIIINSWVVWYHSKFVFQVFENPRLGWTKRSSIVVHHIDDRATCVLHILIALSLALFWTSIFENVALKMEFQELHI